MAAQRTSAGESGNYVATSTIIPCHGHPGRLRRAVGSVRAQDEDCELIIVDDGSEAVDATAIAGIGRENRAEVIRLETRSGPAAARNAGIDACVGDYIAFLDADDVWLPGKLALQRAEMERRSLVFSYMRYANVQGGWARPMPAPDRLTRADLMRNTAIGCSTVMLQRDFVGHRRFPNAPAEDFAFWAALLDSDAACLVAEEVKVLRYGGGRSRNKLFAAWRHWCTLRGTLQTPFLPACGHFTAYAFRAVQKHWLPTGTARALDRIGVAEP